MSQTTTVTLVTGANKGIGPEVARQPGQRGLTVLLGARDAALGERAAETLRAEGAAAQALTLDVTDEASVQAGATPSVRLATLSSDGPTAGFFNIDGAMPW